MTEPRILIYDIETSPYLIEAWGTWQTDALRVLRESVILSYAYKWLGEKKVYCDALPDFPSYKKDKFDDTKLVTKLHSLFDEADIIVAHNGDKFDQKRSQGRFLKAGLSPPSPYRSIDTLKVARRYFSLPSNRLDSLGQQLELGRKVVHTGKDLWFRCMDGDPKAWAMMKRYNKQDVALLEDVYLELRPWISNHPNLNAFTGETDCCPKCGSDNIQRRGHIRTQTMTYQRVVCLDCGGWSQLAKGENTGGNIRPK